jgi:hypothetical protein
MPLLVSAIRADDRPSALAPGSGRAWSSIQLTPAGRWTGPTAELLAPPGTSFLSYRSGRATCGSPHLLVIFASSHRSSERSTPFSRGSRTRRVARPSVKGPVL